MNRLSTGLLIYAACAVVFLAAPIAIVIAVAFTSADYVSFPPTGLSLRWFQKVLGDPEFVVPLWNSIKLGVVSTLLSIVLAVPAALVLVRHKVPFGDALQAFLLSPLSLPTIILAIGLLFFVGRIGLAGTFAGLVAGHTVITVPYVLRTVLGVYAGVNREVEEAATVLGAGPLQTFGLVTLPLIAPGLFAGGIFAFLLSFDEVAVALLLSNSNTTTLPVSILSYVVYNYDPAAAAVSAVQIAIIVVLLVVLERLFGIERVMFTSKR